MRLDSGNQLYKNRASMESWSCDSVRHMTTFYGRYQAIHSNIGHTGQFTFFNGISHPNNWPGKAHAIQVILKEHFVIVYRPLLCKEGRHAELMPMTKRKGGKKKKKKQKS